MPTAVISAGYPYQSKAAPPRRPINTARRCARRRGWAIHPESRNALASRRRRGAGMPKVQREVAGAGTAVMETPYRKRGFRPFYGVGF